MKTKMNIYIYFLLKNVFNLQSECWDERLRKSSLSGTINNPPHFPFGLLNLAEYAQKEFTKRLLMLRIQYLAYFDHY
jgi:hypothetical protein